MKKNIEVIFKDKWKCYLTTYILGYFISLMITGVPNLYYLIPIKVSALSLMLLLGNALYYGLRKAPLYTAPIRGLKYMIIVIIMIAVLSYLQNNYGINMAPFWGFQ